MPSFACELRIKGQLSSEWVEWFAGFELIELASGDTLLRSLLSDQAALHGILMRIQVLNLDLLALHISEMSLESEVDSVK
jgi:hypothetical protein